MKLRAQIWCFGVMLLSILVSEAAGSPSDATAAAGNRVISHTSAPAWAASLGRGVTIIKPGSQPAPGTTSPGGVVKAQFAAVDGGRLAQGCVYFQPAIQMKCSAATAGLPPLSVQDQLSLGYIAIKGTQALVSTVGTDCQSDARPKCITNRNPATFLSSRHTFNALYTSAIASEASPIHKYSLITCVKVGSRWYVFQPPSAF
jgi:hypothetical protein